MNPLTLATQPGDLLQSSRGPDTRNASAGGVLNDFFRYHGLWAPGIRLFRALGFGSKAFLISAVFMLPIAWLAYVYFSDRAAAIAFSSKERVGVAYARGALPLLPALQKQRLLALQAAASGKAMPEAAQARADVDAALRKLADVQLRLGSELDTGKAHTKLLESLAAVSAAGAATEAVLAAHSAGTQAFLDLLTTATDNSKLTLDPDLDTHYLIDASLGALPMLIEATAGLHGMSMAVLMGHQPSAEFSKQQSAQQVIGDITKVRWTAGMAKVQMLHPQVLTELQVAAAANGLQRFLTTAASTESPGAVLNEGNAAATGLYASQEKTLAKLDTLLAARIEVFERTRSLTIMLLSVSLLFVWYLFTSFRKVLDGGLKEVALHIDAMRNGDLTTRPRAWGADEAAGLMLTLAQMQTELRRIVGQVRGASDVIVGASTEISSGAKDLHARTEQSAANLEETASAMEEIASTVKSNESRVEEATRLALTNAQAAERGGQIVGEVERTMQAINTSSGRIGDIIGTIDGIAFQINLLALNAAVEAARAGEQGRGFAVVASEVRALAQRSAAAAREIKSLITSSMGQVEGGVRVVHAAGVTIGEIVSSATRVRELLQVVSTGAREQTTGVAQTAQAVLELDKVTQQNAALVEQTATAAATLKERAVHLADEVAQFKLPTD